MTSIKKIIGVVLISFGVLLIALTFLEVFGQGGSFSIQYGLWFLIALICLFFGSKLINKQPVNIKRLVGFILLEVGILCALWVMLHIFVSFTDGDTFKWVYSGKFLLFAFLNLFFAIRFIKKQAVK